MLQDFDAVHKALGQGRSHLLVGNGFSIACDPIFRYQNLYEIAIGAGLSTRAQEVFNYLGTNNFEGVLRLLDDAAKVSAIYAAPPACGEAMMADSAIVKNALVNAVATSHLEHSGLVASDRKERALQFLTIFHNIFTTNYDLLTYWVIMSADGYPPFQDGFRAPDDPDEPYVVFTERLGSSKGLYYLHGALHLHLSGGELRKHTWCRTGVRLTDQIREGLAQQRYPLFVAEGSADRKLEQIQRHGYLWYSLDKLSRIKGPLVVYGHALGSSDAHIVDAIACNRDLPAVFIGLFGSEDTAANQATISVAKQMTTTRQEEIARFNGRGIPLRVEFYQSETAKVWG